MNRSIGALIVCCLVLLPANNLTAQNYRCDWWVVGQGGGETGSPSFRAGSTAGQAAIGIVASTSYRAYIGFWQIDTAPSGIQQEEHQQRNEELTTALLAPAPNPSTGDVLVHYSLAGEGPVGLRVFDLSGRCIRVLANGVMKAGRYSVPVRSLAPGVYFLKLATNGGQLTQKLIIS